MVGASAVVVINNMRAAAAPIQAVVPAECLQYTAVFQTFRLEIAIAMVFGLIIGALAYHVGGNR